MNQNSYILILAKNINLDVMSRTTNPREDLYESEPNPCVLESIGDVQLYVENLGPSRDAYDFSRLVYIWENSRVFSQLK